MCLVVETAAFGSSGSLRDLTCDTMQPGTESFWRVDCTGFAGQNEESGLEGILGIVPSCQHPPTNPEHHRSVPANEFGKRDLVAMMPKAAEQFGIGCLDIGYGAEQCQKAAGTKTHEEIRWGTGCL
jgi:hypothetical protein